jgi:hypothetical protein
VSVQALMVAEVNIVDPEVVIVANVGDVEMK